MENYTPINHADIFETAEKAVAFLKPTETGELLNGNPIGGCKPVTVPNWQPFSVKGPSLIVKAEILENENIKMIFSTPVNCDDISFGDSVKNGWMVNSVFVGSLKEVADYFVNGTIFGTDNGAVLIVNGPKKFTWTYEEPICESCQEKESAQTNDG